MIGGQGSARSTHAWKKVYRALEHNFAKKACKSGSELKNFPKEIEDFANMFVTLQGKRHKADYDPQERFYKSSVQNDIGAAEDAIAGFLNAPQKDRRAFAAHVLFRTRSI